MSDLITVTISWEADPDASNYFTTLKSTRIGTARSVTTSSDQLSFTSDFYFGDAVHQETRAVYADQTSKVIKVLDFIVGGFRNGPRNLRVEVTTPSETTNIPLTIFNQTVDDDDDLCLTLITWAIADGTGGQFIVGPITYEYGPTSVNFTYIRKNAEFYDEFQALPDDPLTPIIVYDENGHKVFDGTVSISSSHPPP